jgi:aspartate carbamoyltransferase regulatory subunit
MDDLLIEITEISDGYHIISKSRYRLPDDLDKFYKCSNPLCRNGGFYMNEVLDLINRKQQLKLFCHKQMTSPKGRNFKGFCEHSFSVEIINNN